MCTGSRNYRFCRGVQANVDESVFCVLKSVGFFGGCLYSFLRVLDRDWGFSALSVLPTLPINAGVGSGNPAAPL